MSEKKELKEEDIKNVSGGKKEYAACCRDCNKPVDTYYDPKIKRARCCVCNGTNLEIID